VLLLSLLGRALDAMAMGDDEAASLGVPAHLVRYGVIGVATLISSISVALAGMIGWVGLVVPHIARLVTGPLNRSVIPTSALLGAIFLVIADGLSRNIAYAEVPIGVVTELLGVPAFILVLRHLRRGWI
jgi:iron complex transport system permease protein